MLNVRLVTVGNVKEKYFADAIAEYVKRLGKYCKFEILEVKEVNNKDKSANIRLETSEIKSKLKGHSILCDVKGAAISSEELAAKIEKIIQTSSIITFVIGGSCGVGNELDSAVNEKISLGRVTFPHQLFRVIFVEQLYRAFTIINNESYHK